MDPRFLASPNGLRFAVEEVIHHDNVVLPLIIRPRRHGAARDPHAGNACVVEDDAEKGEACIAWRGRDGTAEDQVTFGAEVFDPRARLPVSTLLAGSAPVRLVDVREDRAEPDGRRGDVTAAGYEEVNFGDVAPYRAEEPQGAERAEDGSVRRVVEQASQAPPTADPVLFPPGGLAGTEPDRQWEGPARIRSRPAS